MDNFLQSYNFFYDKCKKKQGNIWQLISIRLFCISKWG